MAKWFVFDKGVKAGPFSDEEFFAYLKDKDPARVQIWRQGMSAWVPATNVPQLVALMARPRRAGFIARHARAAVIVSLIALVGAAAMIGLLYLDLADRAALPEAPPQEEAAEVSPAPAEPEQAPSPSRISREDFAEAMRKSIPLLETLQQRFPRQYEDLVSEFYDRISDGDPQAETAAAMRRKLLGMIKTLLPLADDGVLVELNKIVADKYRALNAQNPSHCYAFGSGADSAEIAAALPEDLLRRERDLYELAIRTAAPRPGPDPRKVASLRDGLRRALMTSGVTESQVGLLDAPNLTPEQHAQYCEVTILLFAEIGKLPQDDAATVMRLLMSGK